MKEGGAVGMVLLAWGQKGASTRAQPMHFSGDRDTVRRLSVIAALEGILALLQPKS